METFSELLALCVGNSPVTGEFPSQRLVTRSFDVFFDLRQNTRLNKQSRGWWFETPLHSSWRNCNFPAANPTLLTVFYRKSLFWCRCLSTHLLLDKMAAFSQPIFLDVVLWMRTFVFLLKFHRRLSLTINNNPELVQIIAWRRIGNNSLSEPMLTWFTDAYVRH